MSSLSESKKALQFNREFTGLIEILKGIAASQFQALVRKKQRFEKFTASFDSFFRLIDLSEINSPFVRAESDTTGVVIVTSDEGFMGDLNAKVIEAALKEAGPGKKGLFVMGSHGFDAVRERGFQGVCLPGVVYEKRYEQARVVKDRLVGEVAALRIGRLTVTYPHPVSFTVQRPVVVQLLPFGGPVPGHRAGEAPPVTESEGRGPMIRFLQREFQEKGAILESRPEKIIEYLVGIWITYRLYDLFEESKIAEYAAKTMHLEQSHDRLTEQGKVLRYRYFRARRELIDKGTRETFASILLRRNL